VWWGYGLNPDSEGDFVKKRWRIAPARNSCGKHSRTFILTTIRCLDAAFAAIPCMMLYITSQFSRGVKRSPRSRSRGLDKSCVRWPIQRGAGRCCVHGRIFRAYGQMAVKALLGLGMTVPPVYKGQRNPLVLLAAESLSWKAQDDELSSSEARLRTHERRDTRRKEL